MSDCLFCRIVKKEIPAKIVFENDALLAFSDIDPKAPTHILIIPKRHVESFFSISEKDKNWWNLLPQAANQIAESTGIAKEGFRLVTNCGRDGGQAVDHLHFHLLGGRKMTWPPG